MKPNRLYFGDCLEVLREDVPSESVDLIYLDPPFNSKRIYNAFIGGAQWVAFDDTWRWYEAIDDFDEVARDPQAAPTMEGLRLLLGEGANLAYLSYMANRLRECQRVLKPTGSIYLHCDPTMSHHLRVVMDGIFGPGNFRNEITWQRTESHNTAERYGNVADILLYYAKSDNPTWNQQYQPYGESQLRRFRHVDASGRRYKLDDLTAPRPDSNSGKFAWRGTKPSATRGWGYTLEQLEAWWEAGRIQTKRDGTPRMDGLKVYLDEAGGKPLQNIWTDIPRIPNTSSERLGYPTQKPLALLKRIIAASSNPGDLVLDPFCGCGTTIHAAQDLGRRWIGIDVCVTACQIIERRLSGHFDGLMTEFIGFPKTTDDARELANLDKFRFERWAASLVDGMEANRRQRGDRGIDGRGRIAVRKGQFIDVVSQVKGGSTGPGDVQAFNGARQQAGADLGVFTCFADRVTNGMRDAAASAGRFMETPVIQIYTVEDYFAGRKPELPGVA